MATSSEDTSAETSFNAEATNELSSVGQLPHEAPELHITAERGVLEASAGAILADGAIHVFHQFRSKESSGARWAHVTASHIPYDWDANDDVLRPEGDELDVLAGSAIAISDDSDHVGENHVELFFVTSSPKNSDADPAALLGNNIPHGQRGERKFTIQRAHVEDISALTEISDNPKAVDPQVKRLGPIDIDDSAYPIKDLVTPSVTPGDNGSWVMLALNLLNNEDAEIVVLHSDDLQHWTVLGPVNLQSATNLPGNRPFAPRLVTMIDTEDGQPYDVLMVTHPADGQWNSTSAEVTGYLVGKLEDTTFSANTEFRVLDHGHAFTRPRMIHGKNPVLFGLVGAHPNEGSHADWANCLSTPRALTLRSGKLYQDIVGASQAVQSFSDYALIWTGQLDADQGHVDLSVRNQDDAELINIHYERNTISVTRDGDTRTAPLEDADSDTLTVFIDGPLCEVYADGGAATLTSNIPADVPVQEVRVTAAGGADVKLAMVTAGQHLQRAHAGLYSAEAQERLIADSAQADRDIADGLIDDLLDL